MVSRFITESNRLTESAKEELESLGEETDDVITTTSKLRQTIMDATKAATADGKGFDILDENGNYKSTYEIMQGLSDLYNDIVAKDKELGTNNLNLLLETIAGKNRSNIAASILQNGDMLRSVYEDAQNSEGSATEELNKELDSVEAKLQQLSNRAQEFWATLINSDLLKNGIDLLSTLLGGLNDFMDVVGVLPTLLGTVGAGLSIKNIGSFKQYFNDLQKIQSVINNISNVEIWQNGATGLLNTNTLDSLKTAVSGLSKEQALLVLSTKNLSAAQKEQVLVAAGIISTDERITASAISQVLAKSQLSATEKEELLTKLGLIDATTGEAIATATCTKEQLLKALATKGIVGADAEAIVSSLGLTTANTTQEISFSLLTKSIWANITAMLTWLATNPVGWCILAVGAIAGVVTGYNALTESLEEAQDKASESKQDFDNLTSELEELNSELETTQSRISELEGKDASLTLVEQDELDRLKEQNDELEREIELKEYAAQMAGKKASDDAVNAITKQSEDYYVESENAATGAPTILTFKEDRIDAMQRQIDLATNYKQEQAKYLEAMQEIEDSYRDKDGNLDMEALSEDEDYKDYSSRYEKISNMITSVETKISDYYNALSSEDDALYDEYGNIISGAEETVKRLNNVFDNYLTYGRGGKTAVQSLSEYFDDSANDETVSKLEDAYSKYVNGEITEESLMSMSEYSKVMDSTGISATGLLTHLEDLYNEQQKLANSTTNETPISFADAWADLDNLDSDSPYADVKEQLEELADAGQLTAKSLSEVDGAEEYFEDIGLSAEEAAQRVNALADESTQLASMGSQISKMSDALATKKEDGYVDYSTLSGFDDKIKDLDNWDAFQNALGSSTSSMEECQEAANALANEWVNSNSFLSNLTDANKDYYVTQLKNMGVSNALEVVNSRLTNTENAFAQAQLEASKYANTLTGAKKDSSLATKDLSNMTVEEIQQLYNEMVAANADTEALRLLLAQKYNVNNLSIATAADCLALADLYSYSEGARSSLLELAAAKSAAYTTNVGTAAGNEEDRKKLDKRTRKYEKAAEEALDNSNKGLDLKISQYGSGNNNNTTTDKDGGSSGSSDSKEEIDWIERKLSVLQTAIDLTKSKLENLFKVKSKSNNIQKQISQTKDLLDATRKAATRYKQEANKVKLSDELKKKVRNGDYDITEYSSEIANAINEYQEKYDNYKSMQQQVQELKQSIRELKQDKNQLYIDRADARQEMSEANQANKRVNNAKALNKSVEYQKKQVRQSYNYQIKNAKLDKDSVKVATLKAEKQEELRKLTLQEAENIQAAYDNRLKSNEATQDAIADALTLAETQGNVIGKAYYTGQIATTKKDLKERQKELTDLQNKQKSIKKYTQEWYDAQEMIDDVKAAIRQDEISIAEFQNSINELKWDRFDELINKIDDVTTEIDFLKNTLSDTLFDDKGMITDDGLTAMGLTLMSGNAAMSKRDYYKQQLAQLEKDYANGNGSIGYTTYIEKQREYNQGLQDSISSIVEAKKATVDYVEQGLDAQNEALSEAIEKKKELLEEEKD